MKKNESKEKLLKELKDVNNDLFYEVYNGEAEGDLIGKDTFMYVNAMRYVPNKVLRKWIKEIKDEIKKQGEINETN
jgi:hypothetical protein